MRAFAFELRNPSGLFYDARFQLHAAKSGDVRIDVVIVHTIDDQAYAFHLGANLHHPTAAATDLQILDDGDVIAIGERIADCIPDQEIGF